ncbi:MAG: glycosyltransferase family 39 protein [Patescibacteria group bacterium]
MKHLILVGILFVAAFFRFYNLSQVPPSPSLDEVSIGYNAYSILTTGKDEYGSVLPMLLRAYDDFRPALYVYLTIPFVWVLGLTVVAVRLPSVLLSLITVYVTYLIGRMVGKKYLSFERLGEIAAVILAVSPWHIYISRLGHEANIGLTLTTLGIFFFLRAVFSGKKSSWILAGIAFGLSLHGYQSEKVVIPLLVLFGSYLFWKEIRKAKRHALIAIVVGFAIALPAIAATVSPQGMVRFRATSAFSTDSPRAVSAVQSYIASKEKGDIIGRIIYSKAVTNASIFIENYASHFSPVWLFSGSNREAHKVPGMGLLYLWEAPFLLLGLWALGKSRIPKHLAAFLIAGLLVAPIPGAITTQAPHAMRAYTEIPIMQLIEALGAWVLISKLKKKQLQIFALILGMLISAGVVKYWQGYFVRFPAEQSDSFQYAIRGAVQYGLDNANRYTAIQFSNQGSLYQSYMFFLYYSKFDPAAYHALGGTGSGGFEEAHYIGKYAFGILPQQAEKIIPGTLYFYDAKNVPQGARTLETFSNLDGKPAITATTL